MSGSIEQRYNEDFATMPVVAILRGLEPREALAIGSALVEAGIRILEVPLNSPDPFNSIGQLARAFAGHATVGAGTVLTPEDVERVRDAGGADRHFPEHESRRHPAYAGSGARVASGLPDADRSLRGA